MMAERTSDGPFPALAGDGGGSAGAVGTSGRISLDSTDRDLIDALVEDGRMSFRAIGERIGLAGDATRDRYNRLCDLGIIRVVGVPNPASLGFRSAATIGVSVTGPVGEVARTLARIANVTLVTTTFGIFDILIEMVAADDADLFDAIDRDIRSLPGISRCNAFVYGHVFKFGATQAGGPRTRPVADARDLSADDKALMVALQADGRASFAELAERTGLSYPQVRRRTKMLLDAGVVQISTVVNRPVLGTAVMAAIAVRVTGASLASVADALAAIPRVEIVIQTLGTFDLLIEVACADHFELRQVINDEVWKVPGVASTETFLYVRIERLPVQWGAEALSNAIRMGMTRSCEASSI